MCARPPPEQPGSPSCRSWSTLMSSTPTGLPTSRCRPCTGRCPAVTTASRSGAGWSPQWNASRCPTWCPVSPVARCASRWRNSRHYHGPRWSWRTAIRRSSSSTGCVLHWSLMAWPNFRSGGPPSRSYSAKPGRWPKSGPTGIWPRHALGQPPSQPPRSEPASQQASSTTLPPPLNPPADVRAWAHSHSLAVPARGKLRPEVWDTWRAAHL
jgi:hypothetical protein